MSSSSANPSEAVDPFDIRSFERSASDMFSKDTGRNGEASKGNSEEGILAAVSDTAEAVWATVKNNPMAAVAGAVVGVGAVAAAPFTGGGSVLGAATLLGSLTGAGGIATVAGFAGAGAGAAISQASSASAERAAFDSGMEQGKADAAVKILELRTQIERAAACHADQKELHEFIVNIAAIGFAMAGCDGTVMTVEKKSIHEFTVGVANHILPKNIQDLLERLHLTPPDFDGAMLYASRLGSDNWKVIDGILLVISEADGDSNEHERDFLLKWDAYKAAQLAGGTSA